MHSIKPQTIDEYLAPLSVEKRAALEKLRQAIKSAAPRAEECISYQLPAFRLDGRMLVAFGAAKNHCAFYPGASPIETHKAKLKDYTLMVSFTGYTPSSTAVVHRYGKTQDSGRQDVYRYSTSSQLRVVGGLQTVRITFPRYSMSAVEL